HVNEQVVAEHRDPAASGRSRQRHFYPVPVDELSADIVVRHPPEVFSREPHFGCHRQFPSWVSFAPGYHSVIAEAKTIFCTLLLFPSRSIYFSNSAKFFASLRLGGESSCLS